MFVYLTLADGQSFSFTGRASGEADLAQYDMGDQSTDAFVNFIGT